MNYRENIRSSFHNIFSHKIRTSLTLIGITIGVMAVILMFSTIYGIKNLIKKNMEGIGWNNSVIIVQNTGEETNNNRMFRFYSVNRKVKPLTLSDYTVVKKLDTIKTSYGMIESWDRNRTGRGKRWIQLRGTNVSYFKNKNYILKEGRFFNAFEDSYSAKVCILGYYYAKDHYPGGNALNQEVGIGKNTFKVIGVLDDDNLNYKNLGLIQNGGDAMDAFANLCYENDENLKAQIKKDLLKYCELDTFAMVKLVEKLKEFL